METYKNGMRKHRRRDRERAGSRQAGLIIAVYRNNGTGEACAGRNRKEIQQTGRYMENSNLLPKSAVKKARQVTTECAGGRRE